MPKHGKLANEALREQDAESIETPGLAELVAIERLIAGLSARRDALKVNLKPSLAMFWIEEARRTNGDTVPKTFRTEDRGIASCLPQIKVRTKKPLDENEVERINKASMPIPLRTTGKTLTVNTTYLADPSVVTTLRKLSQNARHGLPSDLVFEEEPQVLTEGDATLMRVLRLPPKEAVALLDCVADISITKPILSDPAMAVELVMSANPGADPDSPDLLDMLLRSLQPAEAPSEAPAITNPEPAQTSAEAKPKGGRVAKRTAVVVPLHRARG